MQAIAIKDGKGPATSLYITTIDRPTPGPGQALVHIKAFGLNRMDLLQREGQYPVPPQAPSTLGVEFSGVIESLGTNDTDNPSSSSSTGTAKHDSSSSQEPPFRIGDQVFGLAYGGAYAEYISVSTKMLIHRPAEVSFELCAGISETWITALQAMYIIGEWEAKAGKSILWHAGASSVSIAGIQLSRANGAGAVYATARSDEKCDFCVKELGADRAFNTTTSEDWAQDVLDATDGRGVDVIVDFVGASYFDANLRAAARDARIVNLASLGGMKLAGGEDLGAFVRKRIRFEGSSLRSRDEEYQGRLRDQLVEHALPKMRAGEFKIPIERVFDWKDIVAAHQLMESNKTKGKIICTVPWT